MIIITNNSLVPTKRKRNENENKRQPRMTMTLSEARLAVSQCEQEIQTLKATLRRIGMTSTTTTTGGGDGDEEEEENTTATQNKVEITFTKLEGWPEQPEDKTPPPVVLTLQMSSPIETQTVASPDTVARFRGVDTAMAVCTVDAITIEDRTATYTVETQKDKPAFEVAAWCCLPDPHQPTPHTTDLVIPIRITPRTTTTASEEKEKDEKTAPTAVTTEPATDGTHNNNNEEEIGVVLGTVTVQVVFTPSRQDQREAVYEVLNQTSQRKATALATLRKLATTAPSNAGDTKTASSSSSSVQPGFLNRTTKANNNNKDEEDDKATTTTHRGAWLGRTSTRLSAWWTRVTGPQSLVRKAAFLTVVTKDYWIFLGAVGFCQCRGHLLALPPPV